MLNILYIFSQQHQTCTSTSYTNQQISFPSHYTILWYIHFTDYKKSKDEHVSYSIINRQAQKKPTNSFTMLVRRSNNLEKAHTKATAQYPWSRETFGRHQRPSKRARSDPASPTDCTIEERPPKKKKIGLAYQRTAQIMRGGNRREGGIETWKWWRRRNTGCPSLSPTAATGRCGREEKTTIPCPARKKGPTSGFCDSHGSESCPANACRSFFLFIRYLVASFFFYFVSH